MKVMMVPVADRPECKIALEQAFRLARELNANIIGCHLRLHRTEGTASRKTGFRLRLGGGTRAPDPRSEDEADLKSQTAHRLFEQHAGQHRFDIVKKPHLGIEHAAQWIEMVGDLDKLFSIVGPLADLSLVSRPRQTARGRGAEFLMTALLGTGKPVLVLPQTPLAALARRILVPWNQSTDAARAVAAALPLLIRADSVHICSAGPENRAGPKSANLAQYLTYWGVKSTRSSTRGTNVESEVEEVCKTEGSDLVVMGAYSRSRMREMVFGGMTQHMLFETSMPVFALHS